MICPLQWTISTKSLVFTNFYKNVDFLQDLCKRQEKQTSDTRRELDFHSNFPKNVIILVVLKILLLDFEIPNCDLPIVVSELVLFLLCFLKIIVFFYKKLIIFKKYILEATSASNRFSFFYVLLYFSWNLLDFEIFSCFCVFFHVLITVPSQNTKHNNIYFFLKIIVFYGNLLIFQKKT